MQDTDKLSPRSKNVDSRQEGNTSDTIESKFSRKHSNPEKEIAVIGDEDTCIGFSLAGIKHITAINENVEKVEILMEIKGYMKTPEIGFIIITQKIAELVRTELEKLKGEKELYPIFIELPDKHGEAPDRTDPIKLLIRRAIGMEVIKN